MPPNRLFPLTSRFTVGSTINTKYALQAKEISIQALIATGKYSQSSIEALGKANNPSFWPKMLGDTSCDINLSCPQCPCGYNAYCSESNDDIFGTYLYCYSSNGSYVFYGS